MNVDQMINMVVRMIMHRVLGRGVNAGIDMATRKFSKKDDVDPNSPEGKRQAAQAQDLAKRSRQAMRLTRRM